MAIVAPVLGFTPNSHTHSLMAEVERSPGTLGVTGAHIPFSLCVVLLSHQCVMSSTLLPVFLIISVVTATVVAKMVVSVIVEPLKP